MSRYLERLKVLAGEKHNPEQVAKVSKATFATFDTSQGAHVFPNEGASDTFDTSMGRRLLPTQGAEKDLSTVAIEERVAPDLSRDLRAIVTVPAGSDPFETAAELIRMACAKAMPGRRYQFRLVDEREADRRNAEAARNHSTDRFCRCGHLATFAWPGDNGREVWRCDECAPTWGRA